MIALAGWYDTINWQGHRTCVPRLVNDNAALKWTAGIAGLLPESGQSAIHPIVAFPAGRCASRFQPVRFRERQHHALATETGWKADDSIRWNVMGFADIRWRHELAGDGLCIIDGLPIGCIPQNVSIRRKRVT